jgi:prepilin-type N-terminal cleavage/methylation domain-containing protein
MNPAAQYRRFGFTLIELMVAVTLLAVVFGIVSASFIAVSNTEAVARQNAEATRFRSHLRRVFTDNLSSVASNPDYGFIGLNDESAYGPADSLEFVCLAEASGSTALPGVTKYVRVEVREAASIEGYPLPEEDQEEAVLEISEQYMVQTTSFMGEQVEVEIESDEESAVPRHFPIHTFDVYYYDAEAEEWVEEWDSTAIGYLPWSVNIKINFSRTRDQLDAEYFAGMDPRESPDLEIIVPLPAGAGVVSEFVDPNHSRSGLIQTEAE